MRQRGKVLVTEGPTPKFLYAMLKQLDLKIIDWNQVALDIEISNGHAARMRFSRFRNQMEGTTGAKRGPKKNTSKGKKGEKCDMEHLTPHLPNMLQNPNPNPNTLSVPMQIEEPSNGVKMEPRDNEIDLNTVKCEPNNEESSTLGRFPELYHSHHWCQPRLASSMDFDSQMHANHPFFPNEMYFPLEGIPHTASSIPEMSPQQLYLHAPEIRHQQLASSFPHAPVLRWEPPASPRHLFQPLTEEAFFNTSVSTWEPSVLAQSSSQPPAPVVKTEEDNELTGTSCKIETYQLD
ncbi:hypothetical protein N7478_010451 [Penicillium angulare]|uniref:uncharacterized protein n=1 Tax=Penicillium angulare TaxID=116970 RepID=UPI00253F9797|nr:uncharacterized protein N7478_010451 [Penicillium angulare]KAJ5267643.1 hypothetical protein N7478_010451 [Penicillium angulare]